MTPFGLIRENRLDELKIAVGTQGFNPMQTEAQKDGGRLSLFDVAFQDNNIEAAKILMLHSSLQLSETQINSAFFRDVVSSLVDAIVPQNRSTAAETTHASGVQENKQPTAIQLGHCLFYAVSYLNIRLLRYLLLSDADMRVRCQSREMTPFSLLAARRADERILAMIKCFLETRQTDSEDRAQYGRGLLKLVFVAKQFDLALKAVIKNAEHIHLMWSVTIIDNKDVSYGCFIAHGCVVTKNDTPTQQKIKQALFSAIVQCNSFEPDKIAFRDGGAVCPTVMDFALKHGDINAALALIKHTDVTLEDRYFQDKNFPKLLEALIKALASSRQYSAEAQSANIQSDAFSNKKLLKAGFEIFLKRPNMRLLAVLLQPESVKFSLNESVFHSGSQLLGEEAMKHQGAQAIINKFVSDMSQYPADEQEDDGDDEEYACGNSVVACFRLLSTAVSLGQYQLVSTLLNDLNFNPAKAFDSDVFCDFYIAQPAFLELALALENKDIRLLMLKSFASYYEKLPQAYKLPLCDATACAAVVTALNLEDEVEFQKVFARFAIFDMDILESRFGNLFTWALSARKHEVKTLLHQFAVPALGNCIDKINCSVRNGGKLSSVTGEQLNEATALVSASAGKNVDSLSVNPGSGTDERIAKTVFRERLDEIRGWYANQAASGNLTGFDKFIEDIGEIDKLDQALNKLEAYCDRVSKKHYGMGIMHGVRSFFSKGEKKSSPTKKHKSQNEFPSRLEECLYELLDELRCLVKEIRNMNEEDGYSCSVSISGASPPCSPSRRSLSQRLGVGGGE